MKINFKPLLFVAALVIFFIPYTSAIHAGNKNKNAHAGHQMKKHKRTVKKAKSDKLVILNVMPKSGTAREAGFDGKYSMESTTILDSDFSLCAKASRGLIMLDNATFKKCGGRPIGWSKGPSTAKKMDHSKHKM